MKLKSLVLSLFALPLMASATVDVKLLAWNVYMLPKPIKWSIQGDRTDLIAEALKKVDHDVILLEEAFKAGFREKVGKALKATHPYQVSLGRSGYWKHVMPSGLFAVSRYPMRRLTYDYYNVCTKMDCYSSKGVMILEVELPFGKKVHIATTHLNAGQQDVSKNVRATQLEQIVELEKTLTNEETPKIPLVLAGDLNINGHGEEFGRSLTALNMTSTPLENPEVPSSGYKVSCYKNREGAVGKWVDHILLDPRQSKTEVLNKRIRTFFAPIKGTECALSDHQAVEATIRIYE